MTVPASTRATPAAANPIVLWAPRGFIRGGWNNTSEARRRKNLDRDQIDPPRSYRPITVDGFKTCPSEHLTRARYILNAGEPIVVCRRVPLLVWCTSHS